MAVHNRPLTLMAVHAHPDDEAIATGGVLARAAAEGMHTILVLGTRGEEGEVHDPSLDTPQVRHRLHEIRQEEVARAAEILGIGEVHYLGYRDSGMEGTPENDNPHNFHNADADEAVGRLVRLIRQTRPHVLVTYDENGNYGHPDHIAAHRVTLAAFDAAGDSLQYSELGLRPWQPQKLYYIAIPRSAAERFEKMRRASENDSDSVPVESAILRLSVPDEAITTRVPVGDYLIQKRAAMRAHRTQITDESPLLAMSDDLLRQFFGTEMFIRARSLVPAPDVEDDLFAGLREPAALLVS